MDPEGRGFLVKCLASGDEEKRREAMARLKGGLSTSDLEWLTVPLADESWRVRKEAIEGLSMIVPDGVLIGRLVPMMDPSRELTLRNSVMEALERMGSPAVPFLISHLRSVQDDVRKFIVDILESIADPSSVPALSPLLKDPGDNIRAAAAQALAAVGDPSVVPDLVEAIENSDEWVRFSIISSLARLGSPEALPVFSRFLKVPLLGTPSISGIGRIGRVEDGIRLAQAIPSLPRGAAKAALVAAGQIYRRAALGPEGQEAGALADAVAPYVDEEVVDHLVEQLSFSEDVARSQDLVAALGMAGGRKALFSVLGVIENEALQADLDLALYTIARRDPALLGEVLGHHDPLVRVKAVGTVQKLGEARFLPALIGMLGDESGNVRKSAARAVSVMADAAAVDRLLPLLEDEYEDVVQAGAEALIVLGRKEPSAVEAAVGPVPDDCGPTRKALLLTILSEIRAAGWLECCLASIRDEEPAVRAVAVRCIGVSGEASAGRAVIPCLVDESAEVRAQAAFALETLKPEEGLGPLTAAIHDPDPWVRSAALSSFSVQPGADPGYLMESLAEGDLMMKTSVIEALGRMAADRKRGAMEMLGAEFGKGGTEVKRVICRTLAEVRDPSATDLLLEAIGDPDPGIRIFAVQSLSSREDPAARRALAAAAAKDPDRAVRQAARSLMDVRR